jgi:LysR family transcriptional regulator of gallate degradation
LKKPSHPSYIPVKTDKGAKYMTKMNRFVPLRHVAIMLTIEEHGSINAAASILGMTQSALTKALKRAEDEMGVRLFDRHTKGVSPTPSGLVALEHAKIIRGQSDQIMNAIDNLRNSPGRVQVGAGASFLDALLPRAIANVVARHPTAEIHLKVDSVAVLMNRLREGKVDLLFTSEFPGIGMMDDMEWMPLISNEMDVVARAGHPLAGQRNIDPSALRDYGWVLGGKNDPQQLYLESVFRARGWVFPHVAVECVSRTVAIRIVQQSDLLMLLPNMRTNPYHGDLVRIDCEGLSWTRIAGTTVRKGYRLPPAGRTLLSEIRNVCKTYD